MRGSRAAAFKQGKRCTLFQNPKQGLATDVTRAKSGPRTEVLWPTEGSNFQASITVFERYYQGWIKGTVGRRVNRYFVKFDKVQEIIP